MATETRIWTAEDLADLPDDGARYELVKGELRTMAAAGFRHGRIAQRLTLHLGNHVEAGHLGVVTIAETGFLIASNPDTVRAPDIAFVCQERVEAIGDPPGFWPGSPDLTVEVVSPNDRYTEVAEKARAWIAAGTQLVLVVDPDPHTVTVYRSLTDIADLGEADTLIGDPVVPV